MATKEDVWYGNEPVCNFPIREDIDRLPEGEPRKWKPSETEKGPFQYPDDLEEPNALVYILLWLGCLFDCFLSFCDVVSSTLRSVRRRDDEAWRRLWAFHKLGDIYENTCEWDNDD